MRGMGAGEGTGWPPLHRQTSFRLLGEPSLPFLTPQVDLCGERNIWPHTCLDSGTRALGESVSGVLLGPILGTDGTSEGNRLRSPGLRKASSVSYRHDPHIARPRELSYYSKWLGRVRVTQAVVVKGLLQHTESSFKLWGHPPAKRIPGGCRVGAGGQAWLSSVAGMEPLLQSRCSPAFRPTLHHHAGH